VATSLDASTLQQIARLPAIGLAAAAIEKVMPAARRYAAAHDLLRPMLDELWSWLASDKPAGKVNMSEAEAKAMPSGQLYYVHRHRLLELASAEQGKVRQLLGAAFSNLTFSIWLIDRYERTMNPGKPIVLGNDLAEVTWEQLAIGLRMMPDAADDRDEVLAWQTRTVERLIAKYPCSADPDDFGPPLAKDYFLI
jgi:hypothetical protein